MNIIVPEWASPRKPEPLTPEKARERPEYKEYFALALIRILFPNHPERAITTMSAAMGNKLSGGWNTHDLYALAMASNDDQQKADQIVLRAMGVKPQGFKRCPLQTQWEIGYDAGCEATY